MHTAVALVAIHSILSSPGLGLVEIPRVEWRLADVEFGWGLIISAILFAGFNGLVAVDSELHARLVPHAAIAPFMLSLV